MAALFDTDTDWHQAAANMAKKGKVQVLLATPCLEAMLLRAIGRQPGESHQLKDQLAPFVGNKPCEPVSYGANFGLDILAAARQNEKTIDDLLSLFNL